MVRRWSTAAQKHARLKDFARHCDQRRQLRSNATWEFLSSCQWIEQNRSLAIFGPGAIGKTFLASALSYEAVTHGHSAIYIDGLAVIRNLMALKPSRIQMPLAELTSVDLLFIDDFLTLPMSEAEQELLRHLIAMREKSTVLISARHVSSWHSCSPQLTDRLNVFLSHALWLDLYDRGYCPPARRK